jgi:hypothetical protein
MQQSRSMSYDGRWSGRRPPTSLVWPVTFLGAVGPWFWLAHGWGMAVLLGAPALVLTAILGTVWLARVRAAERFNAAMEAYAQREIDRGRRRNRPPRVRGASARGAALPGGAPHGRRTTGQGDDPLHTRAAAAPPARPQPVPATGEGR